jgi:hypothetical protein
MEVLVLLYVVRRHQACRQEHEQAPRSVVRGRSKSYITVTKKNKAGRNVCVIHVAQDGCQSVNGSNLKVVQRDTLYFA